MSLNYPDPVVGNVPIPSRTNEDDEEVPGHDCLSLPGDVEPNIEAIKTSLTTLLGHVDGLETLGTALNGFVDGLEALLGTTNTSLTTLQGLVDGLEGLLSPPSAIYQGTKAVTTAGTSVALAASQALTRGVRVRAKDANTGLIYLGGSSVSSSSDRLAPGESVWIDTNNLANVWIDSAVNGEGVTFSAW